MLGTVRYAEKIYNEYPEDWKKIVERAMTTDYSWGNSAKQYEAMYDELTEEAKEK